MWQEASFFAGTPTIPRAFQVPRHCLLSKYPYLMKNRGFSSLCSAWFSSYYIYFYPCRVRFVFFSGSALFTVGQVLVLPGLQWEANLRHMAADIWWNLMPSEDKDLERSGPPSYFCSEPNEYAYGNRYYRSACLWKDAETSGGCGTNYGWPLWKAPWKENGGMDRQPGGLYPTWCNSPDLADPPRQRYAGIQPDLSQNLLQAGRYTRHTSRSPNEKGGAGMNELLTGEDRDVLSFSKGLTAWWKNRESVPKLPSGIERRAFPDRQWTLRNAENQPQNPPGIP